MKPATAAHCAAHASDWQHHPRRAARQWLGQSDAAYAPHSIAQYSAMVGTTADWLAQQRQCDLLNASGDDVQAYLQRLSGRGGRPASLATRQRYSRLLSLLFAHLQASGLRHTHPMNAPPQPDPRLPTLAGPRQPPRFLDAAQCLAYRRWVLAQLATPVLPSWCEERDAALRMLYLAAGITVAESRALRLADVCLDDTPAALSLHHSHSPVLHRRIPLPNWAVPVLRRWVQRRATLGLQGPVLFPRRQRSPLAAVSGRALESAISTSEIYDTIRPAMQASGAPLAEQLGPQTLRNSYAVTQLQAGVSAEVLCVWMGLRTRFTLDALWRELQTGGSANRLHSS